MVKRAPSTVADFLAAFCGNEPRTLFALQGERIEARTFSSNETKIMVSWIQDRNERGNIYFVANPITIKDKKPKKEHVKEARHLWIDLDPVRGADLESERAAMLSLLTNKLPPGIPEPTWIIDSGRGFWGFWKLKPPDRVDGLNGKLTNRVEARGRGIEAAFGERYADGCRNIDRIARLPGTINHKTGRLAAVVEHHPERHFVLADFPEWSAPARTPGGDPTAEAARVAAALEFIPNEDLSWDEWNRIGMAVWRATEGAGEDAFHGWSRKSDKYDEAATQVRWDHFETSPPTQIGAGTIFHLAKEHGWSPRGDLPVIKVVAGERHAAWRETERALIEAKSHVFERGGKLVRPLWRKFPATKNRTTTISRFQILEPETLGDIITKEAATYQKYDMRRKGGGGWVTIDPPDKVITALLKAGHWGFPSISGILSAPTMRPDGTILSARGYDPATQLWCWPGDELVLPAMPDEPTKDDAAAALGRLQTLIAECPFVERVDESVALAAMLTAVLRGAFDVTPLMVFRAHTPGTGKSYLVDLISTVVHGRPCPVITAAKSEEEMEKRLGAVVLEGASLVSVDNVSFDLRGDLLCQIATQRIIKPRILGQSSTPDCEWRGMLFITGNNVHLVGDLTRRHLISNLDARMERPELRPFKFDPVERVLADRGSYIAAALTIGRAYRVAGSPLGNSHPLGGYSDWSKAVRLPLMWLDLEDAAKSMDQAREEDPNRLAALELIEQWKEHLGPDQLYKLNEIINKAREGINYEYGAKHPELAPLHALLVQQAPTPNRRDIDPRQLGNWLRRLRGQVYNGWRIDVGHESKGHGNKWVLRKA
jgi:putative DNA primase/helicase